MSWTHTETPKENVKLATTKTLTSKPLPTLKLERIGHLYALVIVQNRGKTPANIQRALYTSSKVHLVQTHDISGVYFNSSCETLMLSSALYDSKLRQSL